jgi:DNA-binding IclR family transcriptional regulator
VLGEPGRHGRVALNRPVALSVRMRLEDRGDGADGSVGRQPEPRAERRAVRHHDRNVVDPAHSNGFEHGLCVLTGIHAALIVAFLSMQKQVSTIGSIVRGDGRGADDDVAAAGDAPPRDGSVGTLARGLDIITLFASDGPELSQKEISDALSLPLATVHRLTGVLGERGFLERDPRTRRLRLGLEVIRLVPPVLAGMHLPDLARRHVVELAARTHETVNLAVLHANEVVYLLSETGDRLLTLQATVGQRLPAHCSALGKCLLAHLPEQSARELLGPEPYEMRTAHTLTSWKALAPALAETLRTGVAYSAEEYEIGLVSIAAPVRWTGGPGSAAINVSLPASRINGDSREELVELLRASARAIDASVAIGGHDGGAHRNAG